MHILMSAALLTNMLIACYAHAPHCHAQKWEGYRCCKLGLRYESIVDLHVHMHGQI